MDAGEIRAAVKAFRTSLGEENVKERSEKIMERLFPLTGDSDETDYLCFYPLPKEPDLLPLYEALLKQDKRLYFPKTFGSDMSFYNISSWDDFQEGAFHVKEPSCTDRPYENISRAVCFVPGLAFSDDLHRIGYGRGYYDRYLRDRSLKKIGVCFDEQIFEISPQPFDVDMDLVVTERRIFQTE